MSPIQQHTQEKQTRDGKSLEIQTCHTAHYFHFLKTRGKPATLKASRSIAHKLDGFWLQIRGAVNLMRTRIRFLAKPKPKSMRSVVDATQREPQHGSA